MRLLLELNAVLAVKDMHEVSILQSVLEAAEAYARKENAQHIHRIRLRIGALSGVVEEALQFAFEALSDDTLAKGGALEIERVPARYRCENCHAEFSPEKNVCFD